MPAATGKRETLNIRIKPDVRNLIDRAAKAKGKNRTDFILDAAQAAAEDVLVDSALLTVDRQTYDWFVARLDAPPKPNERLVKTMRSAVSWDRK